MDVTLNKWSSFEGCDFNTKDKDIMLMVEKGELNPNSFDDDGETLLIHSIFISDENMATFLLDHGADPNLLKDPDPNKSYTTLPLIISFYQHNMKILRLLFGERSRP